MFFKIIFRTLFAAASFCLFAAAAVYLTLYNVLRGPSPTVRDMLVLAARQASATKALPRLFFSEAFIEQVEAGAEITQVVRVDTIMAKAQPGAGGESAPEAGGAPPAPPGQTAPASGEAAYVSANPEPEAPLAPETASFADGLSLETYYGPTFKAYVLLVSEPARVYVATSGEFGYDKPGVTIFGLFEKYNIKAAINGGGFYDPDGKGKGGAPTGLTYSEGERVWQDDEALTFIGFNADNLLVVERAYDAETAEGDRIRDGVSFGKNSVLISNKNGAVNAHYSEGQNSLSQRTAIGQRADGAVIMLVTEGRTAAYLGANRNDVIDAMLSFGAVTAGMLDGGSSTAMCCPDYYKTAGAALTGLNEYQKQGLINSGRSFIPPRRGPAFFAVRPAAGFYEEAQNRRQP